MKIEKTSRKVYRSLIALHPKGFRERFGEPMLQTFDDLFREWGTQSTSIVLFLFSIYVETTASIFRQHFNETMYSEKRFLTPNRAALIGLTMLFPITVVYVIAVFNIEPLNRFFESVTTEADGVRQKAIGLALLVGMMLMMPAGFAINLVPIVRNVKAGLGATANPSNILAAFVIGSAILYLWGGLFIDQLPCFMGVPNCD